VNPAPHVTVDGLSLSIADGVPRVKDLDLAAFLGFSRATDIRKLIKRWESSLEGICATVAQNTGKRGRPSEAYLLTEEQALFIVAKSDTSRATEMLRKIIAVFVKVRRGESTIPVAPPSRAIDDLIAADQCPNRAAALELARDVYPEEVIRSVLRLHDPFGRLADWLSDLREHDRVRKNLLGAPALALVTAGVA
jgi:hypothetical protein